MHQINQVEKKKAVEIRRSLCTFTEPSTERDITYMQEFRNKSQPSLLALFRKKKLVLYSHKMFLDTPKATKTDHLETKKLA